MADEFKINMKLGEGVEFNAEGPEALVREALAAFLERASNHSPHSTPPGEAPVDQAQGSDQREDRQSAGKFSESIIDRVFRVDGEVVSLRAIPTTAKPNADALLLLIYGYSRIKNQHDVTATRLAQAARQTGIQTDRLDRTIAQNNGLVVKAGVKKGVRYGLNNPGIKRCEELISTLFG